MGIIIQKVSIFCNKYSLTLWQKKPKKHVLFSLFYTKQTGRRFILPAYFLFFSKTFDQIFVKYNALADVFNADMLIRSMNGRKLFFA